MKKLRQRLAMLLLAFTLIPQAAWALKGSGTLSDPYLVEYGQDLNTISALYRDGKVDGQYLYIELVADVYCNYLTPIGTLAHPFCGYFDGRGHTINLITHETVRSHTGLLFGYVTGSVLNEIKNFTINGTLISSTDGLTNMGGLIGTLDVGRLFNITCNVDIDIQGVTQHHIGGIVGHAESHVTIAACTYNGVINAGKTTDCVGGIVGFVHAQSDASINHCCSNGSIYSTGSGPTLGGILGYNNNENNKFGGVTGCFSRMGLHYKGSNAHVGGIAGRLRANAKTTVNNFCLTDSCGGKPTNTDGPSIPASNKTCTFDECQSGYVTYTLHTTNEPVYASAVIDPLTWVQKLGSDTYPRLLKIDFTKYVIEKDAPYVYKAQDLKCDGTKYGDEYYSNSSTVTKHHEGVWVEAKEPTCTEAGNHR